MTKAMLRVMRGWRVVRRGWNKAMVLARVHVAVPLMRQCHRLSRAERTWDAWLRRCHLLIIFAVIAGIFVSVAGYHAAVGELGDSDPRDYQVWQAWYAPAITMACGYGYRPLKAVDGDALSQFLASKSMTMSCSELGVPVFSDELSRYQIGYRYLIGSVGLVWSITGPDWRIVKPYIAVVVALTALAAFLLARSLVGTVTAVILTLLFVNSPENLSEITRLRDLAKAPFILFGIAAVLWALRYRARPRVFLALSAAFGFVIGFGFGFRTDVLMLLPIGLALLAGFAVAGEKRRRLLVIFFVLVGFIVPAAPLFGHFKGGGNMAHAIALGLSDYSSYMLGVQPGSYAWGINHSDMYATESFNAYSSIVFGEGEEIINATPAYNRAGISYLFDMLVTFPGDMLLRVEAAGLSLIEHVVAEMGAQLPVLGMQQFLGSYATVVLAFLAFMLLAGFFAAGRKGVAVATAFGTITLFLVAMMALQFQHRHYFYVEFLLLLAIVLAGVTLLRLLLLEWRPFVLSCTGGVVLFVLIPLIIWFVQALQPIWVQPRLDRFLAGDRHALEIDATSDVLTRVEFPGLGETVPAEALKLVPASSQRPYVLVMTIDRKACGTHWQYIRVSYNLGLLNSTLWLQNYPREKFGLHSTKYVLPYYPSGLADTVQVTVPMFRRGAALQAILLSPGLAPCVVRWERLDSDDASFSLMNWVIRDDRRLFPYRLMLPHPRF